MRVGLAARCTLLIVSVATPLALHPSRAGAKAPTCLGERATIVGTNGDDRLLGTPARDVIVGLRGADLVFGRGRDDRVCGRRGKDFLSGGRGDDRLSTGPGNNGVSGDEGDDVLQGGAGGDDNANYVEAPRPVFATIKGGFARGQGHDKIRSGIDELFGSLKYGDTLIGDKRPQLIAGLGGDDTLRGGRRDDLLAGGAGNDRIDGGRGPFDLLDDFEFGGPGTGGPETLDLGAGTLKGNGTDRLKRVNGTVGTDGNDSLTGGPGQDILLGNDGNDTISGAQSGDLIEGGVGVDRLEGGPGSDYASYFEFPTAISVDLGAGTAAGPDAATERDTLTEIEDVLGGPLDDTITGDAGPNVLRGDAGADTISGGAGDDTLLADCFGGGGKHITFEFHDDCSAAKNPDALDGGSGTDKCRDGEAVSACERVLTGAHPSARAGGAIRVLRRVHPLVGWEDPFPRAWDR